MIFLISLIIIIGIHELAHLIAAKLCKCGVDTYSIGFGKPIIKKMFRGTEYRLSWLLLGGYCKLKGELIESQDKNAFVNLSYGRKFIIAIAGCAINMIAGILCYFVGLHLHSYYLYYFGYLSFMLGATNWFIPVPCLDGGYVFWYPILTKIYGQKKGIEKFAKAVNISFKIVMVLNILCLPYLIILIRQGAL